ncbi:MAG: PEP-CTERM sorting domain-containing protein, partial [Nitrospiraceae bacterium]
AFPGTNAQLGPILTFQTTSTSLSRGFSVSTVQPGAGFTFNESESGVPAAGFENALSVGDINNYEDDDWSLMLLYGATMSAFGFDLIDTRFEEGESLQIYSGSDLMDTIFFSAADSNVDVFMGITTDYLFDRVVFREDPGGDDIAIADFRFGSSPAVAPEPISSALFLFGGATLGFRRLRKMKRA